MHKQTMISVKSEAHDVAKCIFGTHGEYFPEFGGLQNVFCDGVFFAYYANHKTIKTDTIQKYINGTSAFPDKLKSYYTQAEGTELLYQGVKRLLDACMCTERLRTIQANLHNHIMACATIDDDIIKRTNKHYGAVNANRLQIATYLSCVLWYIIPLL